MNKNIIRKDSFSTKWHVRPAKTQISLDSAHRCHRLGFEIGWLDMLVFWSFQARSVVPGKAY